jgi:hypothetical protein
LFVFVLGVFFPPNHPPPIQVSSKITKSGI